MAIKTVFVVGAGASKEANLPTGYELKETISRLLDIRFNAFQQETGDYLITEALRLLVKLPDGRNGDINPYLYEAWHIRDALSQAISIDNFIDSQRDNEKIAVCGKLAIVKSILEAERNSNLFIDKYSRDSGLDYNDLDSTWYNSFFQLLTENCASNELEKRFKSIALIIFNYDRCIEHYIFNALQNYYRINEDEAANLVKLIKIYHPYGSVGKLPWIERNGSIEFGSELNSKQLLELTHEIKTFAEGTDTSSSDITSIKTHMSKTEKLVFIGFAFHKLNMKLISPQGLKDIGAPPCFATALGISDSDKRVVTQQIKDLYNVGLEVNIESLSCNAFFNEYWRSLSF